MLAARDTRLRGWFAPVKGGWHCSNGITAPPAIYEVRMERVL